MTADILDLANSIADSKEKIRQTIVKRGVACDASVKLADYPEKINNIVVTDGVVANVSAKNCTGAAVKTGGKVFIKKRAAADAENINYTTTVSSFSVVNQAGTKVFYYLNNLRYNYDIESGQQTRSDMFYLPQARFIRLCYHNDGRIRLQGSYATLGETMTQGWDYPVASAPLDYYYNVEWESDKPSKLIRREYGTDDILKQWTISGCDDNRGTSVFTLVGNKLYRDSYGSTDVGVLDENSDTIAFENKGSDINSSLFWATSDNKLGIYGYMSSSLSPDPTNSFSNGTVLFYKLTAEYETAEVFVTQNADLQALLQSDVLYPVYNNINDVLMIIDCNNGKGGAFKWNGEDFETITLPGIDINLYSIPSYGLFTASTDLTKFEFYNTLYKAATTTEGWACVPSANATGDVYSGVALNDAAAGEQVNVKTVGV